MNKIVLGIVLGGVLGILDGLTAWFTPEVRKLKAGLERFLHERFGARYDDYTRRVRRWL